LEPAAHGAKGVVAEAAHVAPLFVESQMPPEPP